MSPTPLLRVIPVWVRLLAGAVAAAAVLAIILLIRGVPGQVIDTPAFIRLAAQAILYLSLIALFGYVAASGLPPTHWLRNAGHPLWPADTEPQLAPDLHRYLSLVHARHPEIRECWLLDSPGQGEWRLLATADPPVIVRRSKQANSTISFRLNPNRPILIVIDTLPSRCRPG